MKHAVLGVALAACSAKSSAPPPSPAPVAKSDAAVARPPSPPIDLPEAGVAALQVVPVAGAAKGQLDLRWRAALTYRLSVVCRIEVYNLADLGADGGGGTLDRAFRYTPEPFVLEPHVCEIRFVTGHALDGPVRIAARVCYHDGLLTAGACAAAAFPPPKLPDGMAIDVQGASVHKAGDAAIELKALVTVGQPVDSNAPTIALRCDGNDSAPGPDVGYLPLSRLAAGETYYLSWKLISMQKPVPRDPVSCELGVSTNGKTLGTFCLAEGSTEPGPCAAK